MFVIYSVGRASAGVRRSSIRSTRRSVATVGSTYNIQYWISIELLTEWSNLLWNPSVFSYCYIVPDVIHML